MPDLSVLHISQTDHLGGSGRSAHKIHAGLRALGVQSRMLVSLKETGDPDVDLISRGVLKLADDVSRKLTHFLGLQYLFFPSSFALLNHPWYREADVIQLYNTHGGYFSHTVLPLMARNKKVVWRLSDLWPLTGHCTFSGSCAGWRTGCKPCPHLDYYPGLPVDTASFLFNMKKYLYRRTGFDVVAPSSWALRASQESPLFEGFKTHYIPNGVDTAVFRPLEQDHCRKLLNIPLGKKAFLFAAQRLPDNERKGGGFFLKALGALGRRDDLMVMLVGEGADQWGRELPFPVWRHELVQEEGRMAQIYNAADAYVHPAVGENLPNSLLEAMACGVPCVAFDAGGVKDAVAHLETGYLSRDGDAESLKEGLRWVLSLGEGRKSLSEKCRRLILDRFTLEKQAGAFKDLYENLVRAN